MDRSRRRLVTAAAAAPVASSFGVALAASIAAPAIASSRRALAPMTDGPFYPPPRWRDAWTDQDADLTRVAGAPRPAIGEHLGLDAVVVDTAGRVVDGAAVEIWQCDALQHYRHPGVDALPGRHDPGFQGYGEARSDGAGAVAFRTIRPVPYPGRTPHIHVKLRHPTFGAWTSQLFVAGEPANARDFLWRHVPAPEREALAMALEPAPAGSGLRWTARHALVVPA